MSEYCALNANANNATAPTFVGGNVYYNDTVGDGSGTDQVLSWDAIAESLKRLYDAHAPMQSPVLCVSPKQLLDLNKELLAGTVGITGAILPRDRSIAGIDIDTIVTPFGSIGLMVIDPNIIPANTAFIFGFCFHTTSVYKHSWLWNSIRKRY